MILFHCHKLLSGESFATLQTLIKSLETKIIIIFRAEGIKNINCHKQIELIRTKAQIKILMEDHEVILNQFSEDGFELISYKEFVEYCHNSAKIIAWK